MKPLSSTEMLELWEHGQTCHAIDRAILLAAAAYSEKPSHTVADLPVGIRDAMILDLRHAVMGPHVRSVVDCPSCSERLEFSFDSRLFRFADTTYSIPLSVEVNGWKFRIPTSRDVARIANERIEDDAARALLRHCWIRDGSEAEPVWSDELLETVETRMEKMDPQGDLNLDFNCERCGHTWQTAFDIAEFFWGEIEVCAKRLLEEVHILATAYGWTEPDVLALSDTRRAAYIDMVMA